MLILLLQAATTAAKAPKEPNFLMYAGSAVFLVGLAWSVMRWVGKTVKQDIDPANTGRMRASMALQADAAIPPAMVKEAMARGLVTAQQMATMSPVERQYLFNQLRPVLSHQAPTAEPGQVRSADAPALPLKPAAAPAKVEAPQLRSTQAMVAIPGKPLNLPPLTAEQIAALNAHGAAAPAPPAAPFQAPAPNPATHAMNAALFGAESLPESDSLKVHCPCCGAMLALPAFPPHVAFCDQCGAKTAVRKEDQGRLVINTAPPGVTRRPVG